MKIYKISGTGDNIKQELVADVPESATMPSWMSFGTFPVDGEKHQTLFYTRTEKYGAVRIEEYPEGLQLWVGGECRWRSYRLPERVIIS